MIAFFFFDQDARKCDPSKNPKPWASSENAEGTQSKITSFQRRAQFIDKKHEILWFTKTRVGDSPSIDSPMMDRKDIPHRHKFHMGKTKSLHIEPNLLQSQ
jgi:hypothetical protein